MTKNHSDTAKPSADVYGLGRASGQRGAEILAGFRADAMPSQETMALSTWTGRFVARILMRMVRSNGAINYIYARQRGFRQMIEQNLTEGQAATVVEVGAGLSPRGLQIAREFPQVQVIEVDLPEVMESKEARVQASSQIKVPDNIEFRGADLGVTPLDDVLKGRKVDIIASEGLSGYLDDEGWTLAFRSILKSLKPGGTCIADHTWRQGFTEALNAGGRIFTRQAGEIKTQFDDEKSMRRAMMNLGYNNIEILLPSAVALEGDLPQPVIDIGWLVAARRADR